MQTQTAELGAVMLAGGGAAGDSACLFLGQSLDL